MQVVLSAMIEDDGTLTYVPEKKQAEELDNISYEFTAEDIKKILHKLGRTGGNRGYTISKK